MSAAASPLARARSFLFVPGDRPERLRKALDSGAQAVIADLEDAVAPEDKSAARRALTGEPRAPTLPTIADAQQRGLIRAEHVRVVERFFPAARQCGLSDP